MSEEEEINVPLGEEEVKQGFNLEEFLEEHRWSVLLAAAGVIVLGLGILSLKIFSSPESKIEILSESESKRQEGTIFVDLQGAVEKPGVYELPLGSRMNDMLILAGGFSAEADREWVARSLNLAQKLADGAKIYIPAKLATRLPAEASAKAGNSQLVNISNLININTASAAQLDTLWGIGPATAQKIIDGRPYQDINDLRTKKLVKANVWEAIKDKITVY